MTDAKRHAATDDALIEAVRVGCRAAEVHLDCSYPSCTCKQIPIAVRAALLSARSERPEQEWRSVLSELADLMDDVRTGDYKPDSFTTQPARNLLASMPSAIVPITGEITGNRANTLKAKAILGVVEHYLRHGDYPHLDKGEFTVVAQALRAYAATMREGK